MQLFKKPVPKEFIPPSESPVWAMNSMVYAFMKR